MDREELKNMVDTLRNQRLAREERIRGLQERIHSLFYRCLAFENRIRAFPPGSSHSQQIKKRLERAKKRLVAMRKRLAVVRKDAPNWQIANVTGAKKGTVDSGIHTIRRNYERNQTAQK
jgi:ribonuclease D